jgi:hypothetical protein
VCWGATLRGRPRIRKRGRRLPLQVRRRPAGMLAKIFGDLQGAAVRDFESGIIRRRHGDGKQWISLDGISFRVAS